VGCLGRIAEKILGVILVVNDMLLILSHKSGQVFICWFEVHTISLIAYVATVWRLLDCSGF
jgi:hypothetical protein